MITGECFCAAVTYEIEGTLRDARSCHCSRCRKAFSGAASAYAELAPGSTLRWTGELEPATYSSAEGWALGFCRRCGSTLCGIWQGEVHGVTLGCVNGDPGVVIGQHIFVGSKAPWDEIGGAAPQHEGPPPVPG